MTTVSTASIQPVPSNRRQPVRQTRTNHARTTTNTQAALGPSLLPPNSTEDPGFFPAITHFTNSITALPKEMIRHYTMLREVDAKIYGPEAELGLFLDEALKHPPPRAPVSATSQDPRSTEHRILFQKMRNVMGATLAILDEKNHVMNTAMDALERQLRRCGSSYPHIEDEISEEARYGSLTHWAYTDKAGEKKSILVGERTRRSQNIQDAKEAEGAAIRSDLRREVVKSSKVRNQHVDSDFDESRLAGKRGQAGAKGRRAADSGYGANGVGLGISTAAPPNKRRKTEKAALASVPMERAMSSIYGSSTGAVRGREPPAADLKKKSRAAVTSNGNTRQRGNTNNSGINSPIVSSPVMGTFPAAGSKDRQGRSPAPAMQRMPSARARQNSSQNVMTLARNRSSSMNHRNINGGNGGGIYSTTADVEKVAGLTGRTGGDVKNTTKEAANAKGEHRVEDIGGSDGPVDVRYGPTVGNRSNSDRNTKREEQAETSNGRSRADRPASISTRGAGGGSKAPSTNPTPRDSTFGERARPPRSTAEQPQKRSHKKGAGLAAQLAAQAAQQDDEGSSAVGDDDDDEDGENEPRYCYCDGVSYGEMVGCDADNCSREWFHLQCVGLTRAPAKTAKWYCDECKENPKRGKPNGGNGR